MEERRIADVAIEKLTRERRRQLTREVLHRGRHRSVRPARLRGGIAADEIAETAGFTRGAIYKNFGGKEELFFNVIDGLNEQTIEAFRALVPTFPDTKEWDLSALAELWRSGAEFDELFVINLKSTSCTCCATPLPGPVLSSTARRGGRWWLPSSKRLPGKRG